MGLCGPPGAECAVLLQSLASFSPSGKPILNYYWLPASWFFIPPSRPLMDDRGSIPAVMMRNVQPASWCLSSDNDYCSNYKEGDALKSSFKQSVRQSVCGNLWLIHSQVIRLHQADVHRPRWRREASARKFGAHCLITLISVRQKDQAINTNMIAACLSLKWYKLFWIYIKCNQHTAALLLQLLPRWRTHNGGWFPVTCRTPQHPWNIPNY